MKTLIVITGPTASGKSALAVELAEYYGTEIVSADSRQIYQGIPIGTAVPSADERRRVPHHLVEILPLDSYYSAALFEQDALSALDSIWKKRDIAILCGGSMMYIDAVTRGIDDLPTIPDSLRSEIKALYETEGLQAIIDRLKDLDPDYLATTDLSNQRRLIHALEICIQAGVPYSSLRTGKAKEREFRIIKMAISMPRERLFDRINRRVDRMVEQGLEEEVESVAHLRHLNSLNTVGYKELFAMRDGILSRGEAIARIAKNTRVYAKKQLLWLSKDPAIHFLDADRPLLGQAITIIEQSLKNQD
ncbi:MAG: tRNA (adenosine(37)-N6)-dimethylallyltransferase MiaA [Duncaniella sp.]|nr:tRNA (adenosine(37)-N6)-dimethylallyltransferase MiaA [Duncaniella sp.]